MPGVGEKFFRTVFLGDFPFIQEEDPGCNLPGKGHFVGHDDHGHAFVGQAPDQIQNLSHHFGIKGGGRLVKEQDLGIHGQRSDDGNPLLLAAGQGGGVGIFFVFQANPS